MLVVGSCEKKVNGRNKKHAWVGNLSHSLEVIVYIPNGAEYLPSTVALFITALGRSRIFRR